MPEPSILFTVTGVVIAGLVAWVGFVLSRAHQPWSREAVTSGMAIADTPIEPVQQPGGEPDAAPSELVASAEEKDRKNGA